MRTAREQRTNNARTTRELHANYERELTRELRGAPVSRLLKAHSAGYRPFTELTLDVVTNLGARAGICSLDGDVRFMLNCMLADIAYFGERQTEAVFVCNELAFLCAR